MEQHLRKFKANIFQALAHPTRIALVELLVTGEQTAGQLIFTLGLEQANASQHLAILRAKQIVLARKSGNQVYYSLRDPVLAEVLRLLRDYFFSQLQESVHLLNSLENQELETA